MPEIPTFSDDSTEQTLAQDDPLSDSVVKGSIQWNQRDNCYSFVWYQSPFWIASENGAYSMTEGLLERLPDHIGQIWVVDDYTHKFKLFDRQQYEDAPIVYGDDDRFENVNPAPQIPVDRKQSRETYDLGDVEL